VQCGFGNLPLSLAKYLESKGEKIMTSPKIANILINSNGSIEVRLLDGKVSRVKEIN
jgi:uncharacterized protein YwbE